jgi:hypothetical protein
MKVGSHNVFILLVLLILPAFIYGQGKEKMRLSISGVVADSLSNKPLAGAVVSVFFPKDTIHFITNTNGAYNFSLSKQPLFLEAAFMGYRIAKIKTDKKSDLQVYDTIRMVQRTFEIDAAVVSARVKKVIYRGDTVQFNAAAFKTLPGANVGSLVAKLPGVTIDMGVWFQGELVSGAYVDGRKVFGSGVSGLGNLMENLDAKDIISIEAFKEISDQDKHLGNSNASKRWIFNFITFSKLTEITVGHALLSYGKDLEQDINGEYKDRYGSGITLNYFGDKKGIFQSNIFHNNINRSTNKVDELSVDQVSTPGENKQTVIDISGSVFLGEKKIIEIQPKYSFEQKHLSALTYREQSFFPTKEYNPREVKDSTSLNEKTSSHNIGINVKAQPKNHTIDIYAESSFINRGESSSILNSIIMDGSIISLFRNSATNKECGFQGRYGTRWSWKLSQKLSFGTDVSASVTDNSQQEIRKDTTIQNTSYTYLNLSGPIQRNGYQITITPKLRYELSRYISLNTQVTGMINNTQSRKIVVDNITGLYDYSQMYNYTDHSKLIIPEVSLTRGRKQLKLVLGLKSQISEQSYTDTDKWIDKHNSYFALLPMFIYDHNALLNTSRSQLAVNYSSRTTIPGSNMLTPIINSGNGSYLTVGNPDLKQSYTHNLSVRLSFMENELSVNTAILGSYITNPIILSGFSFFEKDTLLQQYNNYQAKAGSYLSQYTNGESRYYFSPQIEVSLPVNFLGSILSTTLQYRYENIPVLIDNDMVQSIQQSAALSVNLKSNFSQYLEFNINSQSSYSFNRRSTGVRDRFFSEQLSVNLNAVILSGRINISAYSNTYISRNPYYRNTDQTINLLNASLNYKFLKERNASFGISAHDLLNSRRLFNTITSPQSQTSTWSQVTGTQIMFNFSYKFNYKRSEGEKINDGAYSSKIQNNEQ